MNRRNFLRAGSMSAVPVWLNGMKLGAVPFPLMMNQFPNNDRVLVLVQLNGGNDGINCVIPIDQYSEMSTLRPNIMIPEASALTIENTVGLHPSMALLRNMYADGKMSIVQNVGYPNQDRSHFRSTDIWTTGSDANEYLNTGWLGRYFYDDHPDYPEGYPNSEFDAPFALTMGSLVSETCQGPLTNFSLALEDPFALQPLSETEAGSLPDNNYGRELRFLIDAIAQTNAFASVITDAANSGSNMVSYPANNRLANQLRNVALLIAGGLKTKVYIVSLGGFDTHSGQADDITTEGVHANLLRQLSEAVSAFHEDIRLAGKEEKVLTMTFSEFGRQIKSNDSLGTDHGNAAPLFLFGSCVKPGILGDNPVLQVGDDPQAGVPMQYDFRSVYATVLKDWIGLDQETVYEILHPEVQFLPLIEGCSISTSIQQELFLDKHFKLFPNPASTFTHLEWKSNGQPWSAVMLDKWGHEITSWSGGKNGSANVSYKVALPSIPSGHYYIHLRQGNQSMTKGIVVQ